tara:strand:- start:240 stop:602 length:363 start_codon:yes stop_codon:yes gene_type:complete
MCYPYYENPGVTTTLKGDTPALWRARCTAKTTNGDFHIYPIDFFRLRTLAASMPVDFLFPDRVSNSTLTLSLNQSFSWIKDFQDLDPEVRSNTGAAQTVHSLSNRVPMPITFRASLQVVF